MSKNKHKNYQRNSGCKQVAHVRLMHVHMTCWMQNPKPSWSGLLLQLVLLLSNGCSKCHAAAPAFLRGQVWAAAAVQPERLKKALCHPTLKELLGPFGALRSAPLSWQRTSHHSILVALCRISCLWQWPGKEDVGREEITLYEQMKRTAKAPVLGK